MVVWILMEPRVRVRCRWAWPPCRLERTSARMLLGSLSRGASLSLSLGLVWGVSVHVRHATLVAHLTALLAQFSLRLLTRLALFGAGVLSLSREAFIFLARTSALFLTVLSRLLLLLCVWILGSTILRLLRSLSVSHATGGWALGLTWGAVLRHIVGIEFGKEMCLVSGVEAAVQEERRCGG